VNAFEEGLDELIKKEGDKERRTILTEAKASIKKERDKILQKDSRGNVSIEKLAQYNVSIEFSRVKIGLALVENSQRKVENLERAFESVQARNYE
jgi:hypothetical protein